MVARQNELRDPAAGRAHPDGADSDRIKRDIDRTRAEMDETLDALGERLHPRHLLDDVLDMFRSDGGGTSGQQASRVARNAGRTLVRQVQRHPMPALLCGAGLAWLLMMEEDEDEYYARRRRELHREPPMYSGSYVDARTGEPYDLEHYGGEEDFGPESPGMGEKARGMMGKAQERISGAGHSVKESISGVRESVSGAGAKAGEFAGRTRERSRQWSEGARRRAHDARSRADRMSRTAQRQMRQGYDYSRERFEDAVEDYPLAVGLGFLALGALAGLALPRTRREDELMGEQSDRLKHDVREMGEEIVDRGKHVAESTMSTVSEDAEREGLAPHSLKEKVQRVASKTLSAVEQAAHEEGIAPSDIKEKTKHVAEHAKETAKSEAKKQGGKTAEHTTAKTPQL